MPKQKNNTIESFNEWNDVVDYESDATSVTLLGKRRKKIASFNYPKFTKEDYDRLRCASTVRKFH
jgi:hypothetical protein